MGGKIQCLTKNTRQIVTWPRLRSTLTGMRPNTIQSQLQSFLQLLCWLFLLTGANLQPLLWADPLFTAGITSVGTNLYPYTNKPVASSQINWSRPLSASLVSAVPLNEGSGTNFYDAVSQQSYVARTLAGTPVGALPPAWFTPIVTSNYPWAGSAISNNGATAQAIQSTFQELDLVTNVTVGYSYATLVQPLDTTTFGRIMDATGSAVITLYLNIPGRGGQLSTTWRDASNGAINPAFNFTVNQWMLVLCTVQQGLGTMYVNGVPVATNTNVDLANSWANQTGLLVYNCTGNGATMANANFSSWWIWNNRVLSAQEAAEMSANPWAMFHSGSQRGFLKGTKVVLPGPAVVSNVWFYSHVAAGDLRLGIYDNSSPKNLLWQSGTISNTAAGAWITTPIVTGQPGTLVLAPGVYWLAWQVDTTYDVPSYAAGTDGDGFFFTQSFGNFPGTLAGGQSSGETWSMYLDYAQPAAPSFTGVAFQPGGILEFQLNGNTNIPFGLLVSTNLSSWSRLVTPASVSNGLWLFRDTNAGAFPRRFYRALWP
jgi:hypothetical protein